MVLFQDCRIRYVFAGEVFVRKLQKHDRALEVVDRLRFAFIAVACLGAPHHAINSTVIVPRILHLVIRVLWQCGVRVARRDFFKALVL